MFIWAMTATVLCVLSTLCAAGAITLLRWQRDVLGSQRDLLAARQEVIDASDQYILGLQHQVAVLTDLSSMYRDAQKSTLEYMALLETENRRLRRAA